MQILCSRAGSLDKPVLHPLLSSAWPAVYRSYGTNSLMGVLLPQRPRGSLCSSIISEQGILRRFSIFFFRDKKKGRRHPLRKVLSSRGDLGAGAGTASARLGQGPWRVCRWKHLHSCTTGSLVSASFQLHFHFPHWVWGLWPGT